MCGLQVSVMHITIARYKLTNYFSVAKRVNFTLMYLGISKSFPAENFNVDLFWRKSFACIYIFIELLCMSTDLPSGYHFYKSG